MLGNLGVCVSRRLAATAFATRQVSPTLLAARQSIDFARHFGASAPVSARVLTKKVQKKRTSKKKRTLVSVRDRERMTLSNAIDILRAVEVASPSSMYELTIKTAMGRGMAIPKGRFNLPREAKKLNKDKILVFAEGRAAEDARRAGADIVGGPELVEGVINGKHQATVFLCTPDLIRAITPRLGRILGPRGLMPSERRGTVLDDVGGFIRRLQGSAEWKGDKAGTIRLPIARMDFPIEDVLKNIRYFMNVVKRATNNIKTGGSGDSDKPVNQITKVVLSSRQGPGIQVLDA